MTVFNQEMRGFIELNYQKMTDKELAIAMGKRFSSKLTDVQIKNYRQKHFITTRQIERREKIEKEQRLKVTAGITIHKIL